MKEINYCKNCGDVISPGNFEICDNCKRNNELSLFLKNLVDFLGDSTSFDETDFEMIGIDEFAGYEYIWDLSKLNIITLHEGNFFIDKELIDEFIEKHYLIEYDNSVKSILTKVDDVQEVYDSSKIEFIPNSNYYDDVMNLVENIEFIEESSNIPFPQSDDLNRFIFIGQSLLKKDLSKEDIKKSNQIGNRIVNMYTSTGFYFHVFEKYKNDKKIYYKLSEKGKHIFELDEYQRNLNICKCILEHEILYKIFMDCLSNNHVSKDNIVNIMLEYDLNLNSMVTIKRRASCISSWMHWIFNLINLDDINKLN